MPFSTISSKGQLTLPAEARRALGIRAGDRVLVRVQDGVIVIAPVLEFLGLKGTLGPARSPEEEREAMEQEATDRATGRG